MRVVRGDQVGAAQDRDDGPVEHAVHVGQGVQQPRVAASTDDDETISGFHHQGEVVLVRVGHPRVSPPDEVGSAAAFGVWPFTDDARGPHPRHHLLRGRAQVDRPFPQRALGFRRQADGPVLVPLQGVAVAEERLVGVDGHVGVTGEKGRKPARVVVMGVAQHQRLRVLQGDAQAVCVVEEDCAAHTRVEEHLIPLPLYPEGDTVLPPQGAAQACGVVHQARDANHAFLLMDRFGTVLKTMPKRPKAASG